jgi:DNA-binding transcriptional ArsR family regulator
MSTADLLLHPVRLRILQAFLGERELTTAQLQDELADVPPGSLYRHVARLVNAGVLSITSERRIRGAVERTYVLHTSAATLSPEELSNMTPDEHRQMFLAFVAGLIADFDRYLTRDKVDLLRDGVSYRLQGMWLNEEELEEVTLEMVSILRPRLENAPVPGRQRWILGTVVMPGAGSPFSEPEAVTMDPRISP